MNVPRLIGFGLYILLFLALADLVGITDMRWPWEVKQSEPKLEIDKLAPKIRELENLSDELENLSDEFEQKLRELESTVSEVEKMELRHQMMELRRQIEEVARKIMPYLDPEAIKASKMKNLLFKLSQT
jgi:TolA-binding protein